MVRLFYLQRKGYQVLFVIDEELISCLGRTNVDAFHEIPNRIYTDLTFLTLKAHNHKLNVLSSTKIFEGS